MALTTMRIIKTHEDCPDCPGFEEEERVECPTYIDAKMSMVTLRAEALADDFELFFEAPTEVTLGFIGKSGAHNTLTLLIEVEPEN